MKLNCEVIDETLVAMRDYQKNHFGTPNGPDFPAIAEELARSKAFSDARVSQSMIGMLALMSLPKKAEGPPSEVESGKFVEDLKSSPVRDGLALMFYAGFKLGQKFAETAQPETLASGGNEREAGTMATEIPKIVGDDFDHKPDHPGWFQPVRKRDDGSWEPLKPVIRCNCGMLCGIGLHHVHADGTVTASFYHKKGPAGSPDHSSPDGCEWHVFLKLKDYDGGEFPPNM